MLVMMELIILMILKVHANDFASLSSALIRLLISLHSFQLDNN
jgi:hypothetical protein